MAMHQIESELTEKFSEFLSENSHLPVVRQIEIFKKEFKQSRATFFNWKKNLKEDKHLLSSRQGYRSIIEKNSVCYFCKIQINLIVHHIDHNHNNNNKNNLIILCQPCHAKIHALCKPKLKILVIDANITIEQIKALEAYNNKKEELSQIFNSLFK